MKSYTITTWSLQEFADIYLNDEGAADLQGRIARKHTWGDTALAAISGYDLKQHLSYIKAADVPWLEDHLEELFELDLNVL